MKKIYMLAISVMLLTAVSIMAYPWISNYVNDKYQSTIRTEYAQELEGLEAAKSGKRERPPLRV